MMRKVLFSLALALTIAVIGMYADVCAQYVCGDANSDEAINVSDPVYLIGYIFQGGPAPNPLCVGDADVNTSVNISDAVYLINYIFKGGPAPDPSCCESGCPPTVTDIDGNVYPVVQIGDQCWMAENLKVTHYRNGDPIPNVTDNTEWSDLTTGAYCNYNNDEGSVATYGRLYNWFAVADSRNIAPEGWHLPTDEEWKQLDMYLGMSQAEANEMGSRGTDEGGKLKEAGTTHWLPPNEGATNESGFTALPGGGRTYDGYFNTVGFYATFWSSTEIYSHNAWTRYLHYSHSQVIRYYDYKGYGFSVRCVRD